MTTTWQLYPPPPTHLALPSTPNTETRSGNPPCPAPFRVGDRVCVRPKSTRDRIWHGTVTSIENADRPDARYRVSDSDPLDAAAARRFQARRLLPVLPRSAECTVVLAADTTSFRNLALSQMTPDLAGATVLEIGASYGDATYALARALSSGASREDAAPRHLVALEISE